MYKHWVIVLVAIISVIGIYASQKFLWDIKCEKEQASGCANIIQVTADYKQTDNDSLNGFTQIDFENNFIQTEVSQRVIEKREQLKQAQFNAEREAQKEIEYKEKLLEEGKEVVAEYEAERQEKLTDK